jgi:hypothetical protein
VRGRTEGFGESEDSDQVPAGGAFAVASRPHQHPLVNRRHFP